MAYFYDYDGMLVRVENSATWPKLVVEYGYDPLGNRVLRREYRLYENGDRTGENDLYYVDDLAGSLTQVLQASDNAGRCPLRIRNP